MNQTPNDPVDWALNGGYLYPAAIKRVAALSRAHSTHAATYTMCELYAEMLVRSARDYLIQLLMYKCEYALRPATLFAIVRYVDKAIRDLERECVSIDHKGHRLVYTPPDGAARHLRVLYPIGLQLKSWAWADYAIEWCALNERRILGTQTAGARALLALPHADAAERLLRCCVSDDSRFRIATLSAACRAATPTTAYTLRRLDKCFPSDEKSLDGALVREAMTVVVRERERQLSSSVVTAIPFLESIQSRHRVAKLPGAGAWMELTGLAPSSDERRIGAILGAFVAPPVRPWDVETFTSNVTGMPDEVDYDEGCDVDENG